VKRQLVAIGLCLALAGFQACADDQTSELVYIGTHGTGKAQQERSDNPPQGIYAARFDTRPKTLFVANYGSGSVTALPLHLDGSLGAVASSTCESMPSSEITKDPRGPPTVSV
jgi:hypothetical protein